MGIQHSTTRLLIFSNRYRRNDFSLMQETLKIFLLLISISSQYVGYKKIYYCCSNTLLYTHKAKFTTLLLLPLEIRLKYLIIIVQSSALEINQV